ncbi:MAG: permease [Spirochaetales bacterium]|nr:permease [Spirochaetales bacterium]
MEKKRTNIIKQCILLIVIVLFGMFILLSWWTGFSPGMLIFDTLISYSTEILIIFPFVFVLISLFEVWVKQETVEKHLGANSGIRGFLWAILLGGTTLGPMLVALPIAHALSRKGARLSVVFTYIGAASVCRIPMTVFEASYLGILFTVIRYAVSIPLIILSSVILGRYLDKRKYTIQKGG